MLEDKFILDACCGPKEMWVDKNHPNTIYIDIRAENKGFIKHLPSVKVEPDIIMDFRNLKFPDKSFKLIAWDPPHMKTLGETSMFRKKYGGLNAETWPADLRRGFNELWRVLEDYGVLMFKWSNSEVKFDKVLRQFPVKPLFRNISSVRGETSTAWFCFMKIPEKSK